jgi:hypothetical protein
VKIENSTAARPQSGLDKADIVVEELVEGGITRFAAIFQSTDPGTVGPVRSLRNVDASIAAPTRGLLAFSGAAGVVLKLVKKAPVQLLSTGQAGAAFHRTSSRAAPHNLYARAGRLWAEADASRRGPPAAYLPFAPDAAHAATTPTNPASRPARSAALTFSKAEHPRWTFQPSSGTWLRSEGTKPATTAGGARLVADNVLVLSVRTRDTGYRDPVGNPVPETVLTGSGKLTVLTAGRQVSGTWHKASRDSAFTFTAADGGPLLIAPGRSWIELVPTSGSVRIW